LRAYLFHLENGFPFKDYVVQGRNYDANSLIRNVGFRQVEHKKFEGFEKIAVVRDPIRRFLSGYSNRVLHYRELSEEKAGERLKELGLRPDPDLPLFVENFQKYCKASRWIGHHFSKQQTYLGKNKRYYNHIFQLEKIGELAEFLNAKLNVNATFPRLQTGGQKIDFSDLPLDLRSKVFDIVSDDIAYVFNPGYAAEGKAGLRT